MFPSMTKGEIDGIVVINGKGAKTCDGKGCQLMYAIHS